MLVDEEDEEDDEESPAATLSVAAVMLCREAKAAGLFPMSPLSSASELYAEREDSERDMMPVTPQSNSSETAAAVWCKPGCKPVECRAGAALR